MDVTGVIPLLSPAAPHWWSVSLFRFHGLAASVRRESGDALRAGTVRLLLLGTCLFGAACAGRGAGGAGITGGAGAMWATGGAGKGGAGLGSAGAAGSSPTDAGSFDAMLRQPAPHPDADPVVCGAWALVDNVCCAQYCSTDDTSESCTSCGGPGSARYALDQRRRAGHSRYRLIRYSPSDSMLPRPTIEAFDSHLAALGLRLEAVVIGGSALALLGMTTRQTRDFDILAPVLPREIAEAAREFARAQRRLGIDLMDDWLNNGPMQVGDVLPKAWQLRTRPVFEGRALVLSTLGRADLLKTKLFALCDRGTDLPDCVALAPTMAELDDAVIWLAEQDANPEWPAHVNATIVDLSRRLGHGV